MRIRSYARAFPSDRRIYRIDRWTVPLPGGLPLAASAWFLAFALAMLAIGQLPGIRSAVHVIGWPAAVLVGPGAGAVALTRRCEDGRTLPAVAFARIAYELRARLCPKPLDAPAPLTPVLIALGDTTLPGRVRVHGPGAVSISPSTTLERSADNVVARATDVRQRANTVIATAANLQVIEVRA